MYTRSDGFTETPDGNFALVMRARTGCNTSICWFQYRPSFQADAIRVEWNKDDTLVLLPPDIVNGLLRARYGRLPTQVEIATFLAGPLPEQILGEAEVPQDDATVETAQAAPQAAETPAVVPVATPAPENAPVAAPVAATADINTTLATPTPAAPVVLASPEQPADQTAEPETPAAQTPAPVAVPEVPKAPVVTAPPKKK